MKSNDTYIKLYRKLIDNKKLWRDQTATRVLTWLLLRADYKTGTVETGRFVAAEDIGIKPTTFYQSLVRLKNMKIIDIKSNNKYSTISILNWSRYQGGNDTTTDNKVTTDRQQNDNKMTLYKNTRNKEYKNTYSDTEYDREAAKKELASIPKFRSGELEKIL